jgi:hypothetical protein
MSIPSRPFYELQLCKQLTRQSVYSVENKILLSCSAVVIDEASVDSVKEMLRKDPIDYEYLLIHIFRNGITQTVCTNFSMHFGDLIPVNIMSRLRSKYDANKAKNMTLTNELLNLLQSLDEDFVLFPFKGPLYAASFYDNLLMRQFTDLDLFTLNHSLHTVTSFLLRNGYLMGSNRGWQSGFIHNDSHCAIDLHIRLTPKLFPIGLSYDKMVQNACEYSIFDTRFVSFSPEDILIIMCIYIARDSWNKRLRLVEFVDLLELLNTYPNLDWDYILNESSRAGCQRIILLALFTANALFQNRTSDSLLKLIDADDSIPSLADYVVSSLPLSFSRRSGIMTSRSFTLHLIQSRWDRLAYYKQRAVILISICITPTLKDKKLIALPESASLLYYPLRLIRVFLNFLKWCKDRLECMLSRLV